MISISSHGENNDSFNPSSFCSVATKEVKKECLFLIYCIRRLYKRNNIIIYCDLETKLFIESKEILNVECVESMLNTPDSVVKRNNYHRIDAITLKMDALEYGVNKFGDCVFLDSDIVLLEKLTGPSDCQVALSLNLTEAENFASHISEHGFFNAGMVWTNNNQFCNWWRTRFLQSGQRSFYEQSLLNKCPGVYRTSFFDNRHNYGFWRGRVGNRSVLSFHCHLDNEFHLTMAEHMMKKVQSLKEEVLSFIEFKYPDIFKLQNSIFE